MLRDEEGTVLFAWLYPDETLRMDGQGGVQCAIFRNESARRSSDIILEAEQHALARWPELTRFYTYVDPRCVASPNPGYCYKVAGWRFVRLSAGGKHLLAKEVSAAPGRNLGLHARCELG